jgi:hypothetical protein
MYIQPYTVSIPPMDYELLKNLSEKFGWIVEPNTELEFNETTCAAISESKLKNGKRFKDVESLIFDLQQ